MMQAFGVQYKHNRLEAYINAGGGLGTTQTDSRNSVCYSSETWNTTKQRLKSNDYVLATAGADYSLTKHSSIGFIASYTNIRPDADTKAATTVSPSAGGNSSKYYETFTDFDCNYNRSNANLHYTINNIGNGGSMNVNVDYLNFTIDDRVDLRSTYDENLSYLNIPKTSINIYQGKADMELPIGHATVSYGAAYSQSKTDNRTSYERISSGYDLNDHFVYREHILAAYADVKYKFSDRLEAKLGLRGEYGKLDGNSIKMNRRTVKHQFDLFPTAYLNYSWNDKNSLSVSISGRINRPSYVDINPFTTYIDSHTVQSGNPELQPEKSYSSEVGYTFGNFSVSAGARWRNRVITSYTSVDDTRKLTTITVDNVMKTQMYSLDMSYYFDKVSWFDSSVDGSVYTMVSKPMSGYDLENENHTSVFVYINNNFYLNRQKTLVANLWGQYQAKEKDVVGESPSRYRVDFGLKYLLLDKKLSIGIEYQNMLASHAKSIVSSGETTYIYDGKPYRVLNLSVSYRLGKKLNITQKRIGINTDRL